MDGVLLSIRVLFKNTSSETKAYNSKETAVDLRNVETYFSTKKEYF